MRKTILAILATAALIAACAHVPYTVCDTENCAEPTNITVED